jgi:hypothetical protein
MVIMEKDNLNWKTTVRCEPQTLSDLQVNTLQIQKLREDEMENTQAINELRDFIVKAITIWSIFLSMVIILFVVWALPVFRLLVNRLLSVN